MNRLSIFVILFAFGQNVFGQTNTFPDSGNVGIGTTSPGTQLHIKPNGPNSAWLGLDKNAGMETGIQFLKSGSVLYYLYSDNDDNDALKIQSTGVSGENDGAPRIFIPFNNKDLYFGLSGGNVAIGHKTPYASSRFHVKASSSSPWTILSEASSNDRIIGVSHNGSAGMVSVSYLGNSGFSPLQFQTSNAPRLTISVDGNIGVGTTSPLAKLHVENGDLLLQNQTSGYPRLWLKDVSGNSSIKVDYNSIIGSGSKIYIRTGGSNALVLNDDGGNVGIGTSSPNEKLTVSGTIYGKEVKVDLSVPGPDYVFEKNYSLPSLQAVHAYIEQNKHLPEVPSAKEMELNGINVGEMNMILLKKVEELTLYLIQMQEQNNRQDKFIMELQNNKQ